ncbi:MAG: DUF3552 domain-containing protein, partial [Bacteroidetes bacterium]|nr:DUF3552 domain-containing protein [Bacteroidota bacterium]
MVEYIMPILVGIGIGLAIGFIIAKVVEKKKATKIIKGTRKEASTILREAKIEADGLRQDKILQAKEKFIELKSEHEKVIIARDKKMAEAEKRTRDKESQISSELDKNKKLNNEISSKLEEYSKKTDYLERRTDEVDKLHRKQVENLEVISGLSGEDAKKQLMETLKDQAKSDAMVHIQETIEDAKLTAQQEARKVILNTIQRVGVEQTVEN